METKMRLTNIIIDINEVGSERSTVNKIEVKQYEAKTITFTIAGTFDLTGAEFRFVVKKQKSDTIYKIEKLDADFNKIDIADRKVKINILNTELNFYGTHIALNA